MQDRAVDAHFVSGKENKTHTEKMTLIKSLVISLHHSHKLEREQHEHISIGMHERAYSQGRTHRTATSFPYEFSLTRSASCLAITRLHSSLALPAGQYPAKSACADGCGVWRVHETKVWMGGWMGWVI